MVERKRAQKNPLQELRDRLRIDRDELDVSLEEQPELYYHVAHAHAQAVAEADTAKLDRDQGLAELDKEIRAEFDKAGTKFTENRIFQELQMLPEARELRLTRYKALEVVNDWQALKDAYHQRSFMLRELVALYIAQRHDSAMAGGSAEARGRIAEERHEAASAERRKRRRGE
jgi:hypothetical protein